MLKLTIPYLFLTIEELAYLVMHALVWLRCIYSVHFAFCSELASYIEVEDLLAVLEVLA